MPSGLVIQMPRWPWPAWMPSSMSLSARDVWDCMPTRCSMSSALPRASVISWRCTSCFSVQNSSAPARLDASRAMTPSHSVSRRCIDGVRSLMTGAIPARSPCRARYAAAWRRRGRPACRAAGGWRRR
ncbi:Uncharacterised protein [Bordetella pertussis]|nr:Uncharacterised protein [Bordetella pertussis]CFW37860.1 Uncharacterised protein [Bordetella pertussis]